ncbi:MAG: hypothetical protein R6U91_04940 [Bacillota bacterium]
MFGLNLPARGLVVIIGVVLILFIVGCAEQVPAEEERGAETPDEDEEAPDVSAEGLSDQVYFSKERPHYRTETPLVSPDQNYLLGTLEGQLMLYEYPEKELLNSFDFDRRTL